MNWKLKLLVLQAQRPQWAIAQDLNWSESRFSRVLSGRIPLTEHDAQQLAHVLGVARSSF